jgi:hypothetical protein
MRRHHHRTAKAPMAQIGEKMASQMSAEPNPCPTAESALTAVLPWSPALQPAMTQPRPSSTQTLNEPEDSTFPASLWAVILSVAV